MNLLYLLDALGYFLAGVAGGAGLMTWLFSRELRRRAQMQRDLRELRQ